MGADVRIQGPAIVGDGSGRGRVPGSATRSCSPAPSLPPEAMLVGAIAGRVAKP